MFKGSLKVVSRIFWWHFKGLSRKFQGGFMKVSWKRKFQGGFQNVSREFQENFQGVSKKFLSCAWHSSQLPKKKGLFFISSESLFEWLYFEP